MCPIGYDGRYMKHYGAKCLDLSIMTPSLCKSRSGKWINPSTTKQQCEKRDCYEPLPDKTYGLLYAFGFSEKSNDSCVGSGSKNALWYPWEKAFWVPSIIRAKELNWTEHSFENIDETGTRVLFNSKFYKTVVDKSLGASIVSTTSSAALCDFSSTKAVLDTVTCDCYGGNGECFNNDLLVPLVVGKFFPEISSTDFIS
jgi:hypothetical protein